MKNIFLPFLCLILSFESFSQVSSFKINKQVTSIKQEETKSYSIVKNGKTDSTPVYKTLDMIYYTYAGDYKKDAEQKLAAIKDELYNNAARTDHKPLFDPVTLKTKSDSVHLLQNLVISLQNQQDSLYFEYTKDVLAHDRFNILCFNTLRSRAFFDLAYSSSSKRFRALGNAGLSIGGNAGSIYSEIVSGNMGLFKVGLGAMISNSQNDDDTANMQEEAYQRLVNYGGNTVLTLEYPLAYLHSRNNLYNFISRFTAKGTADFPAFGTNTDQWAGSASVGIDFYGDAALSNNQLRFFFNLNESLISGTDVYKTNLGIDNRNFSFGQLTVGIVFLENYKLSVILSTFSSQANLRNRKAVIGGQVLK